MMRWTSESEVVVSVPEESGGGVVEVASSLRVAFPWFPSGIGVPRGNLR
jgi:hypothetical protein